MHDGIEREIHPEMGCDINLSLGLHWRSNYRGRAGHDCYNQSKPHVRSPRIATLRPTVTAKSGPTNGNAQRDGAVRFHQVRACSASSRTGSPTPGSKPTRCCSAPDPAGPGE